jgi:hypothetical protein
VVGRIAGPLLALWLCGAGLARAAAEPASAAPSSRFT